MMTGLYFITNIRPIALLDGLLSMSYGPFRPGHVSIHCTLLLLSII